MGRVVRNFTGNSGRTIMTEQQYDDGLFYRTYYSYDLAGRLRYTVPPKAHEILEAAGGTWDLTSSTVSELLFSYVYDEEGRISEARFPDKAPVYYLYDPLGRTALVQDGRLRQEDKWTFIKYDRRQRPVYSGIWTSTKTRSQLQQDIDSYYSQGGIRYERESASGLHGYTNNVFPQVPESAVLTVSYYDHYDTDRDGNGRLASDYYEPGIVEGQEATAHERIRGMAVVSKERVLGTDDWLIKRLFYDEWGRVIQSQSNNHLNLQVQDISTVAYDFEGKPLRQETTVYGAADSVTTRDRFSYDHAGRVLQVHHQVNEQPEVLVANYRYNTLGQLIGKDLHGYQDNSRFFQAVDMRHNIRGWLTALNDASLDSVQTNALKDVFGFELRYNEQEAGLNNEGRYDGNISAIVWKANNEISDNQPKRTRSYTFAYDDIGRLLSADYKGYENGAWNAEADAYDVNGLSYDANGNIEGLTRYAQLSDTSAATVIDQLTYNYKAGSNRLLSVSDASANAKGFIDGATLSTEYTYDQDGNLTQDENKAIDITYNILSKTATVTSDSATVTYVYSATGQRLQERVVINSDSAIIRDMIGGMVWEHKEGLTPALSYLPMPEGRLVKQDTSYRYEYFYTDHQGNTRVSWTPVETSQNQHLLTMEAGADEEGDYPKFKNVTTFRDGTQALSGASSAKVTNATGPYISIPVMKGDTIDASVYYYYDDQSTSSSSQQMLTSEQETGGSGNDFTFTAPLFTTTPRIPGTGDNQAAGGGVRFNLAALYPIGKALFGNKKESTSNLSISESTLSTAPAAYLELILYDKDSALVSSQAVPVGSSTFWAQINGTLTASDNGYVVVQLRSQDTQDVWFDDLQIDHRKPDRAVVLQENHYYPFGLQMEGVAVNTALPTDPNRKLYNAGSDWQKETG
ncbi:hypothetical protein AB9P05_05480 [Roseivirga sp. BDSF3-8]|uniref:hypothetical protein n=1 Tax=Roseivirga sp. BDSF3-8 TaxID=3241598 RepID=UPI003531F518